jgi:hypothetical protein
LIHFCHVGAEPDLIKGFGIRSGTLPVLDAILPTDALAHHHRASAINPVHLKD